MKIRRRKKSQTQYEKACTKHHGEQKTQQKAAYTDKQVQSSSPSAIKKIKK